ncbi:hypothetical protein BH10PSE4_BH10PSE4_34440 [soil metagenome]
MIHRAKVSPTKFQSLTTANNGRFVNLTLTKNT